MNTWQTIILAVTGNTLVLGVLGWLFKSLIGKLLAQDLERFKASLASETATAVECLKHELQIVAVEHQIRFSKLHEKRAEVIAELYGLLVKLHRATSSFVHPIEFKGEPTKREKYEIAWKTMGEFNQFLDEHRIYLPESICKQLEKFEMDVRSQAIGFGVYIGGREIEADLQPDVFSQKLKAWTTANEYMQTQVPIARAALEQELRNILEAR